VLALVVETGTIGGMGIGVVVMHFGDIDEVGVDRSGVVIIVGETGWVVGGVVCLRLLEDIKVACSRIGTENVEVVGDGVCWVGAVEGVEVGVLLDDGFEIELRLYKVVNLVTGGSRVWGSVFCAVKGGVIDIGVLGIWCIGYIGAEGVAIDRAGVVLIVGEAGWVVEGVVCLRLLEEHGMVFSRIGTVRVEVVGDGVCWIGAIEGIEVGVISDSGFGIVLLVMVAGGSIVGVWGFAVKVGVIDIGVIAFVDGDKGLWLLEHNEYWISSGWSRAASSMADEWWANVKRMLYTVGVVCVR
jgi:hypothetical protein